MMKEKFCNDKIVNITVLAKNTYSNCKLKHNIILANNSTLYNVDLSNTYFWKEKYPQFVWSEAIS